MKILVTGGAGFIGSNFIRHILATTGHSVINVDKLSYAAKIETLADVMPDPRHQFAQLDICDAPGLRHLIEQHQPDAFVHLAAESHVDRSIDGPGDFVRTNIVGTYELLQAARAYWERLPSERRRLFRFVHVSTDEVFGSLEPGQPPFHEATRYDPHSPYAASKAASDHLVRAWAATYGLPVLLANCSNNYGPFQFPEKLVPLVILKALRGEPIPVYGHGLNVRDWLYVEDNARALLAILERGRSGETYAIGAGNEQRNIDLVRRICRLMDEFRPAGRGHEQLIALVADRPGHDLRYAIDSTKARKELGWTPLETADSGLRKTVRWYLLNEDWWKRIIRDGYSLERLGRGTSDVTSAT